VRDNSRFWNVSGVDLRFGLFRGAEVNIESLRSLAVGGISFGTPTEPGKAVVDGSVFRLYEKPADEWLEWSPAISLPGDDLALPK
jgi:paraquat-inducible protein B